MHRGPIEHGPWVCVLTFPHSLPDRQWDATVHPGADKREAEKNGFLVGKEFAFAIGPCHAQMLRNTWRLSAYMSWTLCLSFLMRCASCGEDQRGSLIA